MKIINNGGHIIVVLATICAVAILVAIGKVTAHSGLIVIIGAAGVGAGISGGAKVPGSTA